MNKIPANDHQGSASPKISHAAILAAPLWTSGLVFLTLLFAMAGHGQFFSLQFLALAVAIFLGSTVLALRVMDHDLQHMRHPQVRAPHSLKQRSRRLHGARLI